MDAKSLLVATAFRHAINEPNIEAGFERFCKLSGRRVDYQTFCDVVAACVGESLIREPVRLPEGALQCHWHLELTPAGVAAARLLDGSTPPPDPLPQGEGESGHRSVSPPPLAGGGRGEG